VEELRRLVRWAADTRIPLPDPRGTSGVRVSAAQRTNRRSSSTPRGSATPAGTMR